MIKDIINVYREAFRQWVRSKTKPKTVFEAEEKKLFWSKCYALSVSCAVGILLFHIYKEDINFGNDKNVPMGIQLARRMNENESIRVIKYVNFKRVSDETLNVKDIKENTLNEEGAPAPKVSQ